MRPLPTFRRWLFPTVLKRLQSGLTPIVALRGSRQVGKTTLQLQVIEHLLRVEGVDPRRIFRVQFDEVPSLKGFEQPVLTLCQWYQEAILRGSFNEWARRGELVYIFLDEVQNLPDWVPQIKSLLDHHAVPVLLTGSSALRIEQGCDSLAGRISTLEMGTLHLREVCALRGWGELAPYWERNGTDQLAQKAFWSDLKAYGILYAEQRKRAFETFAERGGYPIAQARPEVEWHELADQLNEAIIRRVIRHDLRMGERGRKRDESLLEELFRLCCRYAGQVPTLTLLVDELKQTLQVNVGVQRVGSYLRILNDTLLIRLINPLEIQLKRRKGASKICLCDHSLRASWLQESVSLTPEGLQNLPDLASLAGHIVESIVGFFLSGLPNLDVAWFPPREGEPEVEFVLTVGGYRIPIEVKFRQRIDPFRGTEGLRAFIGEASRRAPFGLLVTLRDEAEIDDPRIVAIPLSSLLMLV